MEGLDLSLIHIFVEVKGAGHMVMLEAPQKVNRAIASFLKKIAGG